MNMIMTVLCQQSASYKFSQCVPFEPLAGKCMWCSAAMSVVKWGKLLKVFLYLLLLPCCSKAQTSNGKLQLTSG